MNTSLLPPKTHSPPCTPQDYFLYLHLFHIPSEPPHAHSRLCPAVTPGHSPVPSRRERRGLQPIQTLSTDVGFVTLPPPEPSPSPPPQLTCHPICHLQGRSGARWVPNISQLGALSFTFFLPLNKMFKQRKNKAKKLA